MEKLVMKRCKRCGALLEVSEDQTIHEGAPWDWNLWAEDPNRMDAIVGCGGRLMPVPKRIDTGSQILQV